MNYGDDMSSRLGTRHIIIFFIIIMLSAMFSMVSGIALKNEDQKHVLILNSYHEGFTWTREIVSGILSTLYSSDHILDISIEYMDWKNYPTEDNLKRLAEYYRYKYRDRKVDVIITSDDAALDFSLKNRAELFSDAPVVFCGVNEVGFETIASGHDNVTGILEQVDPGDTVKLAIEAMPNLKKIYIVYDTTESGMSSGQIALSTLKKIRPDIEGVSFNDMTYQEIFDAVEHIGSDSAIFIVSFYSDREGKSMSFEQLCHMISQRSKVPVFHLYDFTIGHGAIGGSMLSGKLQGEYAAKIALRILEGESASDIPISREKTVRTVYDYEQLIRFGIPLDRIDPNSEIINDPFAFFRKYRLSILGVLGVIAILTVLIIILFIYVRRLKIAEKKLQESYEEMEATYEELYATQGELSVKYEEMKDIQEKLRQNAYHDSLTGLPNRLSLFENMEEIIKSKKDELCALLYVDSDNFKFINDTLGHTYGDKLIVKIGKRLSSILKKNQKIYRLGGDEFIICFTGPNSISDVEKFAEKIIQSFARPFNIGESTLYVTVSVGIAIYPDHGTDTEELLRHADLAMYRAKATGKNRYYIYNKDLQTEFENRMKIEKNLRGAIANNEFFLYYQPQMDILEGKITGFEALLRWKNPEMGLVPPLDFIGIAEETHLIIPIGQWVLKNACMFLKKLNDMGYQDMMVAVNVSILQLLQEDFVEMVLWTIEESGLRPDQVELEITESILVQSYQTIRDRLLQLKEAGVKIALDDFGKGYSSLSSLRQLPINTLKIDKSFVDSISTGRIGESFIDTIVMMGRKMGLVVLAEGVEKKEQMEYLIKRKCHRAQGYFISRPMPEDQAILLCKDWSNPLVKERI